MASAGGDFTFRYSRGNTRAGARGAPKRSLAHLRERRDAVPELTRRCAFLNAFVRERPIPLAAISIPECVRARRAPVRLIAETSVRGT